MKELQEEIHDRCENGGKVRLMFQDEAGFGRINKPKYCWCKKGIRPVRQGESCFLVLPYCNTICTNIFLQALSEQFKDDLSLLCCGRAAWHQSKALVIPDNIRLFFIPPYTPEMNPIEQIWKEIRKLGFKNEVFASLDKVILRLCNTISSLSRNLIAHITGRSWILNVLISD